VVALPAYLLGSPFVNQPSAHSRIAGGTLLSDPLPVITLGTLVDNYPDMRQPIIDGLLRVGETANIIAPSKVGKSWLAYGLAISIATGRPWLDTFPTTQGNVLLIDNELHPETMANRLPRVAEAMGVEFNEIKDSVSIVNLRGRLLDLNVLGSKLLSMPRDHYRFVILDAMYRALPAGTDENDNAAMAGLYNDVDRYADTLGSAFGLIHHASKGNQSGKSITDVGSGAGSQSRAADTHLILRQHEEDNVFVLDAAVRSWPKVEPMCLRWKIPTWEPAPDLDPKRLRSEHRRPPRPGRGREPGSKVKQEPWTAERFAATFGKPELAVRDVILDEARLLGDKELSPTKAKELLKAAIARGYLFARKEAGANSKTLISNVSPEAN
jgi:hypothetical protein